VFGSFLGAADVRLTDQFQGPRRVVQLLDAVSYTDADGQIVIPAGTRTDWTSAPRWLWWLFPVFDKAALGALLHDYLLSERPRRMSRAQIDRKFREAMRLLGVSQWRRNALWLGVRLNALYRGDR
jgi:hypothetical protein